MRDDKGRFTKGYVNPPDIRQKISKTIKRKVAEGTFFTEEHRRKISESKKGEKNQNFGKHPSRETREKRSKSLKGRIPWNKGKKWPEKSGENAPGWRGGVSPKNHILRHSLEYHLWRTAVFERDNYTCIWCGTRFIKGITGNVKLEADHIKPFAYYPELRFAIDNGRTLCENCHKSTETYGRKNGYK